MKTYDIFSIISRLLLIAVMGSVLRLSVWQLMNFFGWTRNTAWIANLVISIIPFLSLAGVCSIFFYGALLRAPSTRPLGVKWLLMALSVWLFTTLIVLGGIYSSGTAYLRPIDIVGGAAYLAAWLSLGFILGPLFIVRAVPFVITKVSQLKQSKTV